MSEAQAEGYLALAGCRTPHACQFALSPSCLQLTWPRPFPLLLLCSPMQIIAAVTLERRSLSISQQWPSGIRVSLRDCCLLGMGLRALADLWVASVRPKLPASLWSFLQDLISACLRHDPSERPTAQQIFEMVRWLIGGGARC